MAFVLPWLVGCCRSAGGGRKSRAAAVGACSALLASPRLAGRRAEASRAGPACVHACGRGGCRMGLAKAGRERMGWVFFPWPAVAVRPAGRGHGFDHDPGAVSGAAAFSPDAGTEKPPGQAEGTGMYL